MKSNDEILGGLDWNWGIDTTHFQHENLEKSRKTVCQKGLVSGLGYQSHAHIPPGRREVRSRVPFKHSSSEYQGHS